MSYFELTENAKQSFLGRSYRFGTVEGPQELYSFSDQPDRPNRPDKRRPGRREPMYFLTKSNLLEAIRSGAKADEVFEYTRQGVALCEDWNEMRFLFILSIDANSAVGAWFGLAKFQPRISAGKQKSREHADPRFLDGGWLQYVIDVDARLLSCISGPIRTGR